MPAPYPLLDMPPGDFENMFDYQAINMAAAHNMLIQGINAIVLHAPTLAKDSEKIQPFMLFSLTVLSTIHHHHTVEESFLFPELEKTLGAGSLSGNVEEHKDFVPQLDELKQFLERVKAGEAEYDGALLVEKIHSFSDVMVAHLNQEITTLESSRIRASFTEKDLKDIDSRFMKVAMKDVDFYTALPFSIVCGNPATPWFPPFPAPLRWATRWWFARRHSQAWEFGPLDLYGKPRAA